MTRSLQLFTCFFFVTLCACQKDESTEPVIDPAADLYGIWNRLEFGFTDCLDPFDNQTQFGEGSVSFASGGFYSTYSLRNGADRINTVRFVADADSILFLSTETKWAYGIEGDQLELRTNADNGCIRYFKFAKSSTPL